MRCFLRTQDIADGTPIKDPGAVIFRCKWENLAVMGFFQLHHPSGVAACLTFLSMKCFRQTGMGNRLGCATIRRHSRSLEINLQRGIERELKGLVLLFTHWVQASGVFIAPSKPHEYWRWLDHRITYLNFKKEMWAKITFQDCGAIGS
jgi:hypothetical protein